MGVAVSITIPLCRVDSLVTIAIVLTSLLIRIAAAQVVRMYHVGGDYHSIGSNITVISEVQHDDGYVEVVLYAKNSTKDFVVGSIFYLGSEVGDNATVTTRGFEHLSFGFASDPDMIRIFWNFQSVPKRYNQLALSTMATYIRRQAEYVNHSALHVIPCESPKVLSTTRQNSTYVITTHLPGHFHDKGNCSCVKEGDALYNINGSWNMGMAMCGSNAEWIGCENVQCWFGPKDINAIQFYHTVGDSNAFGCNFTEGFPAAESVRYKLDNLTILSNYELKSSDNGKVLSCEVITNFTEAAGKIFQSPNAAVIVYYPPENLSISHYYPSVQFNSSILVNFSFYVHSEDENMTLTLARDPAGPSQLLFWGRNYTQDTLHIYNFKINVTSKQDYGSYQVCVETSKPGGKNCTFFIVAPVRGLSTLIVGMVCGGVYLSIVTVLAIGWILSQRMRKIGCRTKSATLDHHITENHEGQYSHNEPSQEGSPRHAPSYETIDPDLGYAILDPHPVQELVDERIGYEMVDLIDSRVGYEIVHPHYQYDDVL